MLRSIYGLLLAAVLVTPIHRAAAFSILGSKATWMSGSIGYQAAETGGPMFLGEGYRWNIPVATYGFDDSFLTYYGSNGVAAVESAIKILNSLPAADEMSDSLAEFPTYTLRHNNSAAAIGLIDLKTLALSYLMERLGVGAPERWVWSIRQFFTDPANIQHFSVFNPNYDPLTLQSSSMVNGNQFTYQIVRYLPGDNYTTVNFPVDPTAPAFSTTAYYWQAFVEFADRGGLLPRAAGTYIPAVTREDVAALRYLYRSKNYAVESMLPDVVGGSSSGLSVGTVGSSGGSSGGADGVWTPTFSVAVGGGSSDSPWSIVVSSGTNAAAGGTNVVVSATNSIPFNVNALRPGIGKVTFARVSWDSVLSATTKPYAITWLDRYVTNGSIKTQKVSRSVVRPDFLFGAGDLGTVNHIPIIFFHVVNGDGYVNNSALNRIGTGGEQAGPGIINTGNELVLPKLGRYYLNTGVGSGEADGSLGVSFGSFDGSTNPIVAYPDGASIRALADQVLRGH